MAYIALYRHRQCNRSVSCWVSVRVVEAVAKLIGYLVGARVPRARGRAGRATLPGFATASVD